MQHTIVTKLKVAILEAWENFEMDILENLYGSMPKKIIQAIERAEEPTDWISEKKNKRPEYVH